MLILNNLIAHDLNLATKPYDPTKANQTDIDLNNLDEKIKKFFLDHINTTLNASAKKSCEFRTKSGEVYRDCLKYKSDTTKFVSITIDMTHRLHNIMCDSSSKSSGTMIYIVYTDTDINESFFSIFKMDPNNAVQFNRTSNTFTLQSDILPSHREKLHKTAIIKLSFHSDEEVNLYVLDKQQASDAGPSKFFLHTFLDAEEVIKNKSATKLVLDTLKEMNASKLIADGIDGAEFIKKANLMMEKGKQFDFDVEVDRLLSAYILGEADRESKIAQIKSCIREKNRDIPLSFIVDIDQPKYTFANEAKNIKFQFPKVYLDSKVKIENREGNTYITIEGNELTKQ
jgi:hypothetical protein